MKIGMIGLGRMGGNMAMRILAAGHELVANRLLAALRLQFGGHEERT